MIELHARIAALADAARADVYVERLNGQLGNAQTALGEKILGPIGIDFFEGLRGDDAQLGWELPAPDLFAFDDAAQRFLRGSGAQAAEGFNGFELQISSGAGR